MIDLEKLLKNEWCSCKKHKDDTDVIGAENNACPCGMENHHWHNAECGKVIQIG